jgi:hypothetical protein
VRSAGFRLEEIRSVELDWIEGMASIHYEPARLDAVEVLQRLAAATRGDPVSGAAADIEHWTPRHGASRRVKWFRHERRLSTWEVASETPGRIRFHHPWVASDRELPHRIEAEPAAVHGVTHVHARPRRRPWKAIHPRLLPVADRSSDS